MIGFIEGKLLEKELNSCIIVAGGVGYEIGVSLSSFEKLPEVGTLTKHG